jgi:glycosyltransferase involved in cell wall biosynthesis
MTSDVSIILPIHGAGEYLSATLKSIRDQQFTGTFETILVLDRCADSVNSIIEEYKEDLLPIILVSQKPGLVNALNLGIIHSGSTFVACLDSDDIMFENRLAKQFEFMQSYPNVVALGTSIIEIDQSGKEIGFRKYPITAELTKSGLRKQCVIAHPSTMIRRKELIEIGMYRNFFEYAEDYDLWMRLNSMGEILNLEIPLTKYRVHGNQSTNLNLKRGILVSYSVRISAFLTKHFTRDLAKIYGSFEQWQRSPFCLMLSKYIDLRLFGSNCKSKLRLIIRRGQANFFSKGS